MVLLGVGLSACLVPQSVDPNDTRPHTVPIIDLSQLPSYFLSPDVTLYLAGSSDDAQCHCHLQLEIPVIKDEDPTVDLEARWFIDYDLNVAQSQRSALRQDLPGSFNSPGTTRGPVTFDLDADALGLAQGKHTIEMVIAERQGFAPDNSTFGPPNRGLLPTYDGTTYKVVVNVLASSATQCDRNNLVRSPPLVRIGANCAQ